MCSLLIPIALKSVFKCLILSAYYLNIKIKLNINLIKY